MSHIRHNITLKLQTTRDGDIEETSFQAGDSVTIMQSWGRFYLIKDDDGHFYTIGKDDIVVED